MTPQREKLPETREGVIHKFNVGGHKGYINLGFFPDGRPGEIFITMHKDGSTLSGLMKTISILTSICLQNGITVDYLQTKFEDLKFEPSGHTTNKEIKVATSITDYIFRWMALEAAKRKAK